jgi:hypothetical protein
LEHDARLGIACDAVEEAARFTRAAAKPGRWMTASAELATPLDLRRRLRCRPKGRGGFAVAAAKSGYWTNGEWNWHRRST